MSTKERNKIDSANSQEGVRYIASETTATVSLIVAMLAIAYNTYLDVLRRKAILAVTASLVCGFDNLVYAFPIWIVWKLANSMHESG